MSKVFRLLDGAPAWLQVSMAIFLIGYSIVSVYGRLNPAFGSKVFTRIPPDEVQTDVGHIVAYTGLPVLVTFGYVTLLLLRYAA